MRAETKDDTKTEIAKQRMAEEDEGIERAPRPGQELGEIGDHDDDPARALRRLGGIEDIAAVHDGSEEALFEGHELGDALAS